jgi:hypothetical protein
MSNNKDHREKELQTFYFCYQHPVFRIREKITLESDGL